MITKEYTCIVCPKSCKGILMVDDDGKMTTEGYDCKNGETYAMNEYTDPKRMLTTTIKIDGARIALLPVVSSEEISKSKMQDCLKLLYGMKIQAPVEEGEVVLANILNTGADILAARSL